MEKCTKDHLKKPTSKHETLSLVKITDKREAKLITCYSGTLPKVTKPLHEIELAADVRFQTKFVDKMCHMLWLRSPSFVYTLTSARTRYQNFFHLLDSQNASSVSALIPTLDIDLVWRTHFLSFARYHKFCEKKRHGYIWHWSRSTKDDEHSIEATEVLYFKKFGASYQFCQCWYCEGIRDAVLKKPPKTDEELEALMRVVAKVIAKFRVAEISRRQGVKKGPVVSQPSTVRKNYLVKTRLT
jgi:hypothetical protein